VSRCIHLTSSFGVTSISGQKHKQGAATESSTKVRHREQVTPVIEATRITWCSGWRSEREEKGEGLLVLISAGPERHLLKVWLCGLHMLTLASHYLVQYWVVPWVELGGYARVGSVSRATQGDKESAAGETAQRMVPLWSMATGVSPSTIWRRRRIAQAADCCLPLSSPTHWLISLAGALQVTRLSRQRYLRG
jgi:hypothetical protein